MKLNYDNKVDALSIRFNANSYAESDEISDGVIFDYDKKGKIVGIEILNASKILPREVKNISSSIAQ
jgi:uncharacterized protein YuzE